LVVCEFLFCCFRGLSVYSVVFVGFRGVSLVAVSFPDVFVGCLRDSILLFSLSLSGCEFILLFVGLVSWVVFLGVSFLLFSWVVIGWL